MQKDVIIACDFADGESALAFLEKFEGCGYKPFVKIGMELYYSAGPEIVRELKRRKYGIFLDLKLHDIPNTVGKAMQVLSHMDIDMVNLHAGGGTAMMKAAVEGLTRPDGTRPLLIAVTMLTSVSQQVMNGELGIPGALPDTVLRYAEKARESGLDGVVCSPLEAPLVHSCCGEDFLTVTPGVRFAQSDIGDQSRIATPRRAAALGADYIVVGRPITCAADPVAAYNRCLKDFAEGRTK